MKNANARRKHAHPGERLRRRLDDLGISQTAFAQHIGVSRRALAYLVGCQRSLTPDMAWRIAGALGEDAAEWLHTQNLYDLARHGSLRPIRALPQLKKNGESASGAAATDRS